jgi:hypothetical protein
LLAGGQSAIACNLNRGWAVTLFVIRTAVFIPRNLISKVLLLFVALIISGFGNGGSRGRRLSAPAPERGTPQ